MKKIECPSCAMEIDASSDVCPVCQYEFPPRRTGLKWVVILLAIFLLLAATLFVVL